MDELANVVMCTSSPEEYFEFITVDQFDRGFFIRYCLPQDRFLQTQCTM